MILDVHYNNSDAYSDLVKEEIEQSDRHDHHHHTHEHHHHHSSHLDNDGFVSISFESVSHHARLLRNSSDLALQ
jgi:hypothetical protein